MTATDVKLDHAGLALHAIHWAPTAESNGRALLFVHGLGEHAGRYSNVAAYFTSHGYHCFGFDHQGHGRSDGARGTIRSYEDVVAEINTARAALAGYVAIDTQVYLWGHSMGGAFTLSYLTTRPEAAGLAGAIVTAPPLQLGDPPGPFVVAAGRALGRALPNLTKNNELDPNDISRDPGVVSAYIADPLNHDRISLRLGAGLLTAGEDLLARPYALPVPTLLMHGSLDRIAHVDGSRAFANAATGDVTFRVWDGLSHELHNEPEQAEVFAFAKTWIEQAR